MRSWSVAVWVVLALAVGTVFGRWTTTLQAPEEVKAASMSPQMMPRAGFLPDRGEPMASPTTVTGVVREVIQVPNYTYLRLEVAEGAQVWAAVETTTAVSAGARASVDRAVMMHDFASKALGRSFEEIYFGRLGGPAPAPVATVGAGVMPLSALFASRAALVGQTVRVTGVVAKATKVSGVSYLHLQQGGDDVLVTTANEVSVGSTATFEGQVVLDRDLGTGVTHPVVLEGARVVGG